VPTHDPSLDIPSDPTLTQIPVPQTNYIPATDASAAVSQDDAFSRALNAMYWGGYWTAMYHVRHQDHSFFPFFHVSHVIFFQAQRQLAAQFTGSNAPSGPEGTAGTAEEEEEDEDLEEIEIDDEDFTSTQR
jgi:hypothetical protein